MSMKKTFAGMFMGFARRAAAFFVAASIPFALTGGMLLADDSIHLSLSTQTSTVNPGDIITINVNCDSFDSLTEFGPIKVTFDPEQFDYVSVTPSDALSGYSFDIDDSDEESVLVTAEFGALDYAGADYEVLPFYADVQTVLFQVSLRARPDASGTSLIGLRTTGTYRRADGSTLSPSCSEDLSVVVSLGVSTDATLSSLSLEGITMTPAFDPQVFEYSATVSRDIESVTVNATASNIQAIISVEGADELDTGENIVSVHVLAQDGIRWHEYRIFVNRQESFIPEGSGFVDAQGETYTFMTFPGNYDLPEGFMQTTRSINGYTVPVFAKDGIQSVLVYIYNGHDNPDFYFYNPITGITSVFDPNATVVSVGYVLTAIECPEGVTVPQGFTEGSKEINGVQMEGFINDDDVFISYFSDDSGNTGFYMYDEQSGRFFRMDTVERSVERVYKNLFYIFFIASVLQSIFIIIIVYTIRRVISNRTNPRPKRV